MTKKELKQYLYQYQDLKAERHQIEQMLKQLTEPKGLNLDGMPRSSGDGDAMTSIVAKRSALQARYLAKYAELDKALNEIEDLIEQLDSRERTLMRYRYIEGLDWEKVCVAVNYSWRQTHYIHSQALDTLLKKYKEENNG